MSKGKTLLKCKQVLTIFNHVNISFTRMQQELDAGRDLVVPDWHDEAQETVQNWWTRIKGHLESQNIEPSGRHNTFPDEVHPKMQEKIQGVFDGIQEEVNTGRDLDLTQWENEMGQLAEFWWDKVMGHLR